MYTKSMKAVNVNIRSENGTWKFIKGNWDLYVMLVPAIFLTLLFKYVPMTGVLLAFKEYNIFDGFFQSPWVGFGQFSKIFTDPYFYKVLSNSLLISFYKLIWIFPLPILLAVLINELRSTAYKRYIQSVIYLPNFLSWAIVYGMFLTVLGTDGPVNNVIHYLGGERISFFINKSLFRSLMVGLEAWKSVGWGTIIYLAALTGIDQEQYEAATLDGANKFKQILHITLPGILSTVMVMLVLRMGQILNAGFEQILIFYNPLVYDVADIIETYVYRIGLGQQEYSFGSAMGLFNSVVSLVMVVSSNAVAKKFFKRSLW